MAGVVGIPQSGPDASGESLDRAATGHSPSDALTRDIQDFVKARLASHEYPRHIAFRRQFAFDRDGQSDPA